MSKHLSAYIRTRRRGTVQCDACWLYIRVGDRYHVDVMIDCGLQKWHEHEQCRAEMQRYHDGDDGYPEGYLADDDLCDRSPAYVAWYEARKAEQVGQ